MMDGAGVTVPGDELAAVLLSPNELGEEQYMFSRGKDRTNGSHREYIS
jgi:hypothetical protein